MAALVSLELRWFVGTEQFEDVERWFHDVLPGDNVGPVDARNDVYLVQPGVEEVGVKLRQGKLQIKWRAAAFPYAGPHGAAGTAERWIRWDWEDPKGPDPEEMMPAGSPPGPWVTVTKRRRQRKYRWDGGALAAAPADEMLVSGAAVEATRLEVGGRAYGTVLIETFAPDPASQQHVLDTAIERLWLHFPKPLPTPAQSFGYPHWFGVVERR